MRRTLTLMVAVVLLGATGAVSVSAVGGGGTVVAWGFNEPGDPPAGLTDVVAISVGDWGVGFSLALRADGTVVGWGHNDYGQASPPAGLTDAVAASAGSWHGLALKADGTVVAWGKNLHGQTNVPPGLTDVVAVSAGSEHSLALKADGTVVAWGYNLYGQTNVPPGLTDVVAIAAAHHSLALKADGTVVAWGYDWHGQATPPAGLTDVVAISAGFVTSLALVVPNEPPASDPDGPYLGAVDVAIGFDGTASSDPDGDTLRFDWDWGDTTTSSDAGAMPTHVYGAAGIYDVCLTVVDPDGASDSACTLAVVYDPEGGFVTGGGWISSPSGAYTTDDATDPDLTGKATFGFVSKYKNGASTPTGQTEFQFNAGDLNFHSDSYDWLVIAGQDRAKYKGTGTINGAGNYGFMLTAVDNDDSGDTFRIKIWDKDNGDAAVYDNKPDDGDDSYDGTALGGGNIKVHKK